MKKILIGLLLGFFCMATTVSVRADDASLRTALQDRYAAMKIAMGARNAKAVSALLAPDFVSLDVSRQRESASQMLQGLDSFSKDPQKESDTTLLSVKANGSSVIVEQRYDMKTERPAADGTSLNIELVTLSTDTWVKSNGTWLIQRTETHQMDYYVNGQQLAHRVRPGA